MPESEFILLKRFVSNGDAEAFAEIIDMHAAMVYGVCLRILKDKTKAADAVQDTFLQLVRRAESITESLPNWLHQVATNKAKELIRADTFREQRELKYAANLHKNNSKDETSSWQEISACIDEELQNLDGQTREILILRFFEGQKMVSIAEKCAISQQTVSRRIDSGIELLRHKLRSRGVIIPAAILISILTENVIQAAPASIIKELGKIALAGRNASVKPKIIAKILLAKSNLITIVMFAIVLSFVTFHYSSIANKENTYAPKDPNEIRLIIIAKLEKMQNLIIRYQLTIKNPSLTEEMLILIQEETGNGPILEEQIFEQEACILGDKTRYEKKLIKAKYINSTEEFAKPTRREILIYPNESVLRISYDGFIMSGHGVLPRITAEHIFGMRMIDGDKERLNDASINKMEILFHKNGNIILRAKDEKDVFHEWEYSPKLDYALIAYRRMPWGIEDIPHIEAKMTDFKVVDDIMIPGSAIITNQGYQKNKIVEGELNTIEIHSVRFNDPNNKPELYNIDWPNNSFINEENLPDTFRIR